MNKQEDLISRQALLRQIDIDADGEPGYYGDTWKFIDTIKNLPSAQPEVIRCKDCVLTDGYEPIADGRYWCMLHGAYMHYCSDAERRTDE